MAKDVYRHLAHSYGRLPLLWIGVATEFARTVLQRVVVVILMAHSVASVAAGQLEAAKSALFLLVALYVLGAVVGVVGELLAIWATDKKYADLLLGYYERLTSKDMAFYRNSQTGDLSVLFRQHLDGTMNLVRLFRGDVIRMLVSLILPPIILCYLSPKLGFATGLIVVAQSAYVFWASKRMNIHRASAQRAYREISGKVADELMNMVVFKASGAESEARKTVARLGSEEKSAFWQRHKMTALLDLPRDLIVGVSIGLGCLMLLGNVNSTFASVGLLVAAFTYILQVTASAASLPDLVNRHDEHVSRVYATLECLKDTYETVRDPERPQVFNVTHGAIHISGVSFSYKGKGGVIKSTQVFEGLNLVIGGGERVGIVGVSGAGKSTLASLLMRFDDVDVGAISIDGCDLRNVRQSDLRRQIAYVPQEPMLFHRTIRENIGYYKKDASDEDIMRAAKAAHAHEFIVGCENGYDTVVGERGTRLSGGQKQRIVLAREILKNAPIMILDEATSALDSESEEIIQSALPEIIGPHTALVIAHRISTVAELDRILVMHGGRIVEDGSHETLYALGGHYRRLCEGRGTGRSEK